MTSLSLPFFDLPGVAEVLEVPSDLAQAGRKPARQGPAGPPGCRAAVRSRRCRETPLRRHETSREPAHRDSGRDPEPLRHQFHHRPPTLSFSAGGRYSSRRLRSRDPHRSPSGLDGPPGTGPSSGCFLLRRSWGCQAGLLGPWTRGSASPWAEEFERRQGDPPWARPFPPCERVINAFSTCRGRGPPYNSDLSSLESRVTTCGTVTASRSLASSIARVQCRGDRRSSCR